MTPIHIWPTKLLWLVVLASAFNSVAAQAEMIELSQMPLGTNASGQVVDRYTYSIGDVTLQANQLIDIRFDPDNYSTLTNPVAGLGFEAFVFQPGNPPGTPGDYNIFALVDDPSLSGPFSVDVAFTNRPVFAPQPFLIEQYDQNGNFLGILNSGTVVLDGPTASPEPAYLVLPGALALFIVCVARRRSRGSGCS